jgi:hypothetical protein
MELIGLVHLRMYVCVASEPYHRRYECTCLQHPGKSWSWPCGKKIMRRNSLKKYNFDIQMAPGQNVDRQNIDRQNVEN